MAEFYQKNFKELSVKKGQGDDSTILFVTLNSPQNANALSSNMIKSLKEVLTHAEFDKEIRVIVLKGEGKFFCAGGNIKDMLDKKGIFIILDKNHCTNDNNNQNCNGNFRKNQHGWDIF